MTKQRLEKTLKNINIGLALFLVSLIIFNVVYVVWNGYNGFLIDKTFKIGVTFFIILLINRGAWASISNRDYLGMD